MGPNNLFDVNDFSDYRSLNYTSSTVLNFGEFSFFLHLPKFLFFHSLLISVAQPEMFQGREGFAELGRFDEHFFKNARKKGFVGENFAVS